MGYRVSGLVHVPKNEDDWHFYIAGDASQEQNKWLEINFNDLAAAVGSNGVIVAGHRTANLTEDIRRLMQKYSETKVEDLFYRAQFGVLSKGDLLNTLAPIYLVPLSIRGENNDLAIETMKVLIERIVSSIASGDVVDFIDGLGTEEVKLKGGESFFISTMRKANEVLQLKPALFGIGVNLNAAIDAFLGEQRRTIA